MSGTSNDSTGKMLVVDDDNGTRVALERSLRRLGYEVKTAKGGHEALQLVTEWLPGVILTDLRMPEMDGHTFLRRLAKLGLDSAIIVMSAHGDKDDVIDVMRSGAIDFLTKPWSQSDLSVAVARAMELYEKRLRAVVAVVAATPPPAAASRTFFASVLQQLKNGEVLVPSVASTINQLRTLLRQPDTRHDAIVTLIERDQRLTTQILRLSNTPHYASRMAHNSDIKSAVARIGIRVIGSMVETIIAQGCFQIRDPRAHEVQARIWKLSVARAVAMRALAELAQGPTRLEPELAYVGGLLCDAGASFLLWLAAERAASDGQALDLESCLASIEASHQEVGVAVLNGWNVDPRVVALSGAHHAESVTPPNPYWSLQLLAEQFAIDAVGADPTTSSSHGLANVERCEQELGIGVEVADKVSQRLATELAGILDTLS